MLQENASILHTVQQPESVKLRLQKKDTIIVPSDRKSGMQPLNVCINKSFQCYISEQFEKNRQENIHLYAESKLLNRLGASGVRLKPR